MEACTDRVGEAADFAPWSPAAEDTETGSHAASTAFWPVRLGGGDSPPEKRQAPDALVTSQKVEEMLQRAREEAQSIVAEATRRADQIERDAQEAAGAEIERRAAEEADRVRAEETEHFRNAAEVMVADFRRAAEEAIEQASARVAELAAAVTEKIIHRSIAADDKIILDVIADAIGHLDDFSTVRIRVNPRDVDIVSAHESALVQSLGRLESFEVAPDADIQPGGCLIESDRGDVDARISSQFQVIWDHLQHTDILRRTA